MNFYSFSTVFLLLLLVHLIRCTNFDPLGYILYCPCMGRFGNQADHFLGALAFAKALNRTLVLPPWIEYRYGERKSTQIPFDTYFKVAPLEKFHKVVTMEKFMKEIAPVEWPPNERISFCYMARGESNTCNAKDGNPFGPFWDTFQVDFVGSEFYGPLHYDVSNEAIVRQWKEKYSPSRWPVLAFTGSPASFPVSEDNRHLHKYLIWSDQIEQGANNFIRTELPKGPFVGVHLRNGIDWSRACEHIPDSPNLFSAPQCLGYRNERGKATAEMCFPSKESIFRQLKRVIKSMNNNNNNNMPNGNNVKSIFVASDSNHMIDDLRTALKRMKVAVFKLDKSNPHLDLAILGKSNHFIGNCISSFSAFVKRARDVRGFPTSFWGFPPEKGFSKKGQPKDEL